MTNLYKYVILIIFPYLLSCSGKQANNIAIEENYEKKSMLQGTWLDDNTESPMLHIKGDSIRYLKEGIPSVAFRVIGDTLVTYGIETTSYHIEKQNEYTFWIQSDMGRSIHRAVHPELARVPGRWLGLRVLSAG